MADKKIKTGAGRAVTTAGGAVEPQPAPPPAPMSNYEVYERERAGFPGLKIAKDGEVTLEGKVYGKVESYTSRTQIRAKVGNISLGTRVQKLWRVTANGERTPLRITIRPEGVLSRRFSGAASRGTRSV